MALSLCVYFFFSDCWIWAPNRPICYFLPPIYASDFLCCRQYVGVQLSYKYIFFFFSSTCVMDCGFVIFSLPLFDFLLVCDFFLRNSICGCGVVLIMAFWEVGSGWGRVTAEEKWTSQVSLIFLFNARNKPVETGRRWSCGCKRAELWDSGLERMRACWLWWLI